MINWNLHSFQLSDLIQVLDSISWVRCASGNVFLLSVHTSQVMLVVYLVVHSAFSHQVQGKLEGKPRLSHKYWGGGALRVARGQTIMISNSQTFKAQNSGKTEASFEKKRPQLVFLGTPHGDRQRKHLSQVAPYGRKWRRIKRFLPQAHFGVRSNQVI